MPESVETLVIVRWTAEGWHNWPDAPERRAYLRASHRHLFYYEVGVEVAQYEQDRGIEFHDLLGLAQNLMQPPDYGAQSCEMIATALGQAIQDYLETVGLFGSPAHRKVLVSVMEDNECGATVVLR